MSVQHFPVTTRDSVFDCYVEEELLIARGVCTRDNAAICSHFVSSYISLLADSPLNSMGRKPTKVYRDFRRSLLSRPLGDSIKFYSGLFDRFVNTMYLSNEEVIISTFLKEFTDTPIFKEYHEYFKTKDSAVLQYILTFLSFGKKIDYTDKNFNEVAFRNWLKVEEELASLHFSPLNCIRTIIGAVLPDPDYGDLFPRFGPGAVSDDGIRGVVLKANHLTYDRKIDLLLKSYENLFISDAYDKLFPPGGAWHMKQLGIDYSTLRFVPKDITKARSISMEPNTYMYIQQMIKAWMYEAFKRSEILSRSITLEDQGLNQRYALWGSINGSLSTIDLSSASDRVHIDLVRRIFPRKWLIPLLGSRSSKVRLPSGEIMVVKKFAPMGSAVCFPVQCIIFYAIVVYAHLKHYGLVSSPDSDISADEVVNFINSHISRDPSMRKTYGPIAIYGDDIICDSSVVDDVSHALTDLGFEVNESKSFRGMEALRESCGIYACGGKIVTPLRYRVPHFEGHLNPTAFAALPSLINRAGRFGYFNYRRALLWLLRYTPLTKDEYREHPTKRWYTSSECRRNDRLYTLAQVRDLYGYDLGEPGGGPHAGTTRSQTDCDEVQLEGSRPGTRQRVEEVVVLPAPEKIRFAKSVSFPRWQRCNDIYCCSIEHLPSKGPSVQPYEPVYVRSLAPNPTLKRRFNPHLQYDELRFLVPVYKKRRNPHPLQVEDLDFYAYVQDMRARYLTKVDEPNEGSFARYRPEETGYGWRWTPVV